MSAAAASVGPMANLLPELLVTDPAALRAHLKAEIDRWAAVIKAARLAPE